MASEQRGSLAEWTSMLRAGRISRRTFLERAVALGLSSSAPSAITYWNLFGGGDGVRMVERQNDFVRSHPDISLNAVTLAWGAPYYTKLAMSVSGGRPPDIGISHITRMPAFANLGFLEPFDLDMLAQDDDHSSGPGNRADILRHSLCPDHGFRSPRGLPAV